MVSPVFLPLPFLLRLQPLPLRRLRPILASSSPSSSHHDEDDLSELRKIFPRARDMKIEIGRYKGRMLGTLPSSYLNWLADQVDNRAYEFYNWPSLAKLVLEDPVYQDRIEYEPALRLFEGGAKGNFIFREGFDIMKAYRDIGDRYGWDWDDKEGWSKVKRDYIGTSQSGRIPRKKKVGSGELSPSESAKNETCEKRNKGYMKDPNGVKNGKRSGFFVGKKRGERIERMRLRREEKMQMAKSDTDVVGEEEVLKEEEEEEEVPRNRTKKERFKKGKGDLGRRKRELGLGRKDEVISFAKIEQNSENGEVSNPFPGRAALYQKLKREGKIK